MDGGDGFEPSFRESKSRVLPLNEPPIWESCTRDSANANRTGPEFTQPVRKQDEGMRHEERRESPREFPQVSSSGYKPTPIKA